MISFNKKDDKIAEIAIQSQIIGILTNEDYRVYGLRLEGNPPVLLEYSGNSDVYGALSRGSKRLEYFFDRLGIQLDHEILDETEEINESGADYKVYIGLRRDIRDNVPLACAILKTIVFHLEDKLKIDEDSTTIEILEQKFTVNNRE